MNGLNYVVSYPKSGATWFRFLMYTLYHQKLDSSVDVMNFYPEVGVDNENIKQKLYREEEFFVKSHYAYSSELKFNQNISNVVYIIRDPFNCMKSRLDFYRYDNVKWINSKIRRLMYLDEFMDEADSSPDTTNDKMHGGWNFHVKSWLEQEINKTIVVKYEDLILDCEKVVANVCEKLNLKFSLPEIQLACKLSSFDEIKKLEDYEMDNKILGMFYGHHRENTFSKKENVRFVMKGKERNFFKQLSLNHKIKGIKNFYDGLQLGGYDEIINRLDFLLKVES